MEDADQTQITWDEATRSNFEKMIGKIPIFLRGTAEKKVSQKAETLAREDNRSIVGEKDMVDAFFAETPFGFHGPMKCDMEEFNIDYVQYGYDQ